MDITAYITAILQFSMLGSSHRFSGERPARSLQRETGKPSALWTAWSCRASSRSS